MDTNSNYGIFVNLCEVLSPLTLLLRLSQGNRQQNCPSMEEEQLTSEVCSHKSRLHAREKYICHHNSLQTLLILLPHTITCSRA